jgi:MoaA/NifB/PqqE/SkfB family radical SAM enzyme
MNRKMHNKTYCNFIKKGMFVSHQGVSLCCIHPNKYQMKPSEFWNSDIRKNALDNIEKAQKVEGCNVCYNKEEKKLSSSRIFYNSYDDIPNKNLPTMLDLDFSNFCNLKCLMCNPIRSSEWAKDTNKKNKGISAISTDLINDLFKISGDVIEMNIQGGEPSIMKEYEHYFTLLHKQGITKNINLQIITNATNINKKFYNLLENFKSIRLSVSIDAFGEANDYIRWPSNFKQIEKNLIKMSDLKNNVKIEIFNSLNILSMFNYKDFLFWCKKIEKIYSKKNRYFGIVPMKVTNPVMYSPFIAPLSLKEKFINDVTEFFKKENLNHNSNFKTEIMMLLKKIQATNTDKDALYQLKQSVKQLDMHRKSQIIKFIPEFENYI